MLKINPRDKKKISNSLCKKLLVDVGAADVQRGVCLPEVNDSPVVSDSGQDKMFILLVY